MGDRRSNLRRWAVQLVLTAGLALLVLAALLWGWQGVTPARANPGILYVDGTTGSDDSDCSNPADPCATIGYALTQAGNGDEVRVAQGTYTETLDIAITVTLKGGYAMSGTLWLPRVGTTIIDANGANDSVVSVTPDTSVTVEGFTIQGANRTNSDNGGGFLVNGATVVISDTLIQNNNATGSLGGETFGGGGLYFEGDNVNISLINSSLLTNTAGDAGGGAVLGSNGILLLDNVEVRGNTSPIGGGGLLFAQSAVTITAGHIISNTSGAAGGGIYIEYGALHIRNSEIISNTANGPSDVNGGGVAINHGALDIEGALFRGNRAIASDFSAANAIVANASVLTLTQAVIMDNRVGNSAISLFGLTGFDFTNVLIAGNEGDGLSSDEGPVSGRMMNVTIADNTGSGVRLTPGTVNVSNSILWGNDANDNNCTGCVFSYSDIGTGDTTGTHNISQDPRFVDAAGGDYHLGVGSPCIDEGTPAGAPLTDIEGTSRDAVPDMGAYEWAGARIFLPLTLKNSGP